MYRNNLRINLAFFGKKVKNFLINLVENKKICYVRKNSMQRGREEDVYEYFICFKSKYIP